jgi:hypothetical protein
MSAYDFNTDEVTKMLMPPKLRQLKHIAWLKVLLNPLKWLHNNFFKRYFEYTAPYFLYYDSATTYNIDEECVWTDKKGYVCIKNGTLNIPPTGNTASADHWLEFTPNYVAADERAYYRPQNIILVKALNDYFRCGLFQIYIENTGGGTFIIYMPLFYYDLLGATNTERTKAVLDYANKFTAAGISGVTVVSY